MVSYLLKRGASASAESGDGFSALFYAAKFGNVDAVRILLEEGGLDANRAEERSSWTTLHTARYEKSPNNKVQDLCM